MKTIRSWNEDGDLDITDHTAQVAQLYQRKQATYSENRVYPWIKPGDLRVDLIERCRRYVRINKPRHPWGDMPDIELIKSAQFYQADPETGKMGITLAGVMLLGTDDLILKVCPPHRTDLILMKVNIDRYDDRDLVITNLIDSYDRILDFIKKHLPDPFYLEGIERRSLRDTIFREVASNLLIHREYTSGAATRLIIEYGRVVTDNPSRPHGFGRLDPETTVPFQKNPVIGAFFRQIDRADELGSGMRKMMLYGKKYGGADPEMVEGDIFRTVISIPEYGANPATKYNVVQVGPDSQQESGAESGADKVLVLLQKQPLSKSEIANRLGMNTVTGALNRTINKLLDKKVIEYTLPDKPKSRLQKYRLTEKGRKFIIPANESG
jgi:ATP-dependent DNA helicase RecG